ncbi:hypothetical protein LguiA_004362 [Lonicera macranthoides]
MSDNRGKRAAKGTESTGQRFKGRKNNGNMVNPPKKKLVKSMMVEYIAKSTSSTPPSPSSSCSCHANVTALIEMKKLSDSLSSSDEFIKIHTVYSTLSDPEKCADYDRRIFQCPSVSYSSVLLLRWRPCILGISATCTGIGRRINAGRELIRTE